MLDSRDRGPIYTELTVAVEYARVCVQAHKLIFLSRTLICGMRSPTDDGSVSASQTWIPPDWTLGITEIPLVHVSSLRD